MHSTFGVFAQEPLPVQIATKTAWHLQLMQKAVEANSPNPAETNLTHTNPAVPYNPTKSLAKEVQSQISCNSTSRHVAPLESPECVAYMVK